MEAAARRAGARAYRGLMEPHGKPTVDMEYRMSYLTDRFARHAPAWQFVIWLRQFLLFLVATGARHIIERQHQRIEGCGHREGRAVLHDQHLKDGGSRPDCPRQSVISIGRVQQHYVPFTRTKHRPGILRPDVQCHIKRRGRLRDGPRNG